MRENGVLTWLMNDQVNSTTVTAAENGTLGSEIRYTAFGETRWVNGVTVTDQRYTGQREDRYINMYWYTSRWYDPALAHFNQPDIIVPDPQKAQDWYRYAYVSNNPVNFADPTGHMRLESDACYSSGCNYTGPRFIPGGKNDVEKALKMIEHYREKRKEGTTLCWYGLHETERNLLINAGMNEGVYNDAILPALSKADPLHDPVFIISALVGGSGIIKAGIGVLLPIFLPVEQTIEKSFQTNISTGRNIPFDLREQLAMEAVKANPEIGKVLRITMSDPRWPSENGWVKMSQNINGIEIHYLLNKITGELADFKFK